MSYFSADSSPLLAAISAPRDLVTHTPCSLIKNLLRTIFEFTSAFVVKLLLFGHSGCAICAHLIVLPSRDVVRPLGKATLSSSLEVILDGRPPVGQGKLT